MDIEGLRIDRDRRSTGDTMVMDFLPDERRLRSGRIRLTLHKDNDAVVEFLDSTGTRPGLEEGESIAIDGFDVDVGDRILRAAAALHLGIDEATNGYSRADMLMIAAGFGIGRLINNHPAWVRLTQDGFTEAVMKLDMSGLPSSDEGEVLAMLVGPSGSRLTYSADNIGVAIMALDGGNLRRCYDPGQDIEMVGAALGRVRTH